MSSPSEEFDSPISISNAPVSSFAESHMVDLDPWMYIYSAGEPGGYTFENAYQQIVYGINKVQPINRGTWQTLDVSESPMHHVRELRNVAICYMVPETAQALEDATHPDMPWAGVHFNERVSREPLNPAPSYKIWPHHVGNSDRHIEGKAFSHTYPERFWPKMTGRQWDDMGLMQEGIRYYYGDLDDVVGQLVVNPHTRQAVLPVWFAEDTGAIDYRVPCSLFYHFMSDGNNRLSVWYSMRSCDLARHFRNDVYLAGRLLQWVCREVAQKSNFKIEFFPYLLNMNISNLHVMEGDVETLTD